MSYKSNIWSTPFVVYQYPETRGSGLPLREDEEFNECAGCDGCDGCDGCGECDGREGCDKFDGLGKHAGRRGGARAGSTVVLTAESGKRKVGKRAGSQV